MIEVEIEDERWMRIDGVHDLVLRAARQALFAAHPRESGNPGVLSKGAAVSGKKAWVPAFAGMCGICVLLTDDETVKDLNARFRGKDAATNVLAFPAAANPQNHLGDVALALGVCEREAAAQGKPLSAHLQHLVAHGVLHLVGYDHHSDAEAAAMEALEREILAGLGVPDPYASSGQGENG